MDITITNRSSVKEIQEAFNKIYPHLWIDFYYPSGFRHVKPEKINPETAVKFLCTFNGSKSKIINIDGEKSVAQLEKDFWEMLQLKAKVLRKSGNVWVSISYTGNWTLDSQNFEGEQIVID